MIAESYKRSMDTNSGPPLNVLRNYRAQHTSLYDSFRLRPVATVQSHTLIWLWVGGLIVKNRMSPRRPCGERWVSLKKEIGFLRIKTLSLTSRKSKIPFEQNGFFLK
jgi:hypothetical protein